MVSSNRKISETGLYHIYARGVGGQIIYEDDADHRVFLSAMARQLKKDGQDIEIIAWCLMDNHFHMLIRGPLDEISGFMKLLLGRYARYFNNAHGRQGHVFQSRFGSEPIESESYLLNAVRYIHQNPEKAMIAPTDHYRWSSYQEYVHAPIITNTTMIMSGFATVMAFEDFHRLYSHFSLCECDDSKGEAIAKRAIAVAIDEFGEQGFMNLRALPMAERDSSITRLANRGLSTRQIERLTGVSHATINRILK